MVRLKTEILIFEQGSTKEEDRLVYSIATDAIDATPLIVIPNIGENVSFPEDEGSEAYVTGKVVEKTVSYSREDSENNPGWDIATVVYLFVDKLHAPPKP